MSAQEPYPDLLKKVLQAGYYNGFGFQADGVEPPGYLVIAFLSRDDTPSIDENAETKVWQSDLQTNLIKIDEWLGRTFVQVHWTIYRRIPEILQYAVDRGFSVLLRSRFDISFQKGDQISPENWEATFIAQLKSRSERMNFSFQEYYKIGYHRQWQFLCPWNWHTDVGKHFCAFLRRTFPEEIDDNTDQCNFYNWQHSPDTIHQYGLWNFEPSRSERVIQSNNETKEKVLPRTITTFHVSLHHQAPDKPPDLCILCEERTANTKVLPCGDVVVCQECSNKLQHTPDRATCVKCRRPIQMILADGHEPVVVL